MKNRIQIARAILAFSDAMMLVADKLIIGADKLVDVASDLERKHRESSTTKENAGNWEA